MSIENISIVYKVDKTNEEIVLRACDELNNMDAKGLTTAGFDLRELILKLCVYSLDGVRVVSKVIKEVDHLWNLLADDGERDRCMECLISTIEPLLIKKSRVDSKRTKYKGLNPKLGFSFGEAEIYEEWKRNGGLRSIPLCFTILRYIKISQMSQNIWWINPYLLNLLDDTSDLHGIRMPAVLLLRTMLELVFYEQSSAKWISLRDTGLFSEYENLLVNFCFYLPPSYDPADTLRIWQTVIPTIGVLYKAQFVDDVVKRNLNTRKFLGEVVLQNCLLRCGCNYEKLTIFLLRTIRECFDYLGENSTVLLQRLIYDLGQYLVKDPFFTAFEPLVYEVIKTVRHAIEVCNNDRVLAHKYDFMALVLSIYGKLRQEGQESSNIDTELAGIVAQLKGVGVNFEDDLPHLKEINGIDYTLLFST
ncbi:hypothetical protein RNJ44_00564 [Nakaseomyces bracarensis]|uniref:TELO2-interacting protein 2 n=1 Tax=Nakaseomyces bracarensis TaxID=273131 RepID=A0ABR4NT26_9SACH